MKKILISIKAQHMADMLNGEKKYEIRKFLPKEVREYIESPQSWQYVEVAE